MGTKSDIGASSGKITSGILLGTLVHKTIEFVRDHLTAWRDDPNRPEEQAENSLNSQLCDFLDTRARKENFSMVHFKTEKLQAGQRRADLTASPAETMIIEGINYSIYAPILVLEGKRLPAPSSDREKEYVTGGQKKSGGIQRFKLGLHGGKLPIAAMVGYVQDGTLLDWYTTVNLWLTELAGTTTGDGCKWTKDENLISPKKIHGTASPDLAHYQSAHGRRGNEVTSNIIKLHHLWVMMKKNSVKKSLPKR